MRPRRLIWAGALIVVSIPISVATESGAVHAASIVVTASFDVAADDDGLCTLREAIIAANTDTASGAEPGECPAGSGADTITLASKTIYDVAPSPSPILPGISSDATIVGNGSTILSRAVLRVLQVDAGATVEIRDLTLTHRNGTTGTTGRGFLNRGTATLRNVTVVDNSEVGHGGGIYNGDDIGFTAAELTVIDSTIEGNSNVAHADERNGGGIHNHKFASLTVIDSTIRDNTADDHGGGISHQGAHLSVTGGAIRSNAGGLGGGVYIRSDTVSDDEITGTEISSNTAEMAGGGIFDTAELSGGGFIIGRVLTIDDVTVVNNSALDEGGGIASFGAAVAIIDSEIARNDGGPYGGGISAHSGQMTIDGSVIEANVAGLRGGGVARYRGTTDITSTQIRNNVTESFPHIGDGRGGGINLAGGTARIVHSSIAGNEASADESREVAFGGGLHLEQSARLTMSDSTVDSNVATHPSGPARGGGLHVDIGSADIVNSTISGNSTNGSGGGISLGDIGEATVTATTVTGNTADNSGGIWAFDGELSVTASIVAGNTGQEDVTGGTVSSGGFNVMGVLDLGANPFTGPGDITEVADPMLGPLADNGGPTLTHRPLRGSPAIDRVTGAYAGQPAIDQRGVARPSGPHSDAGAVEREVAFESLTAERFADSRDEPTFDSKFRNTGPRRAGTIWEIDIAGRGDVPADATAAIVNVTVLNGTAPGHATVYPCTDDVPTASSINYVPGAVEPNELVVALSADGTVCITTFTDADVLVDVVGFVPANSAYRALTPARFADSRDQPTIDDRNRNTGIRAGGTTWEIRVAGRGDVPATATTAAINLTVTEGIAPGFATVYPCGELPLASSLNYGPGITRPNELIARLSPTGTICVYTLTDVHVIVDVVGFLEDTRSWTPIVPVRYADSRDEPTFDGQQRNTGIRPSVSTWEIPIAGRGGVPATATTAAINLTVTGGGEPGFATVYPCEEFPLASSLNYGPGITRPNELIAKLSPTGTICVFTLAAVHVIVDVVGHDG